ncbi:MAG: type II toxin-antitoxin system PemK/MazF family toxin [Spirochaetes bacterium]|nr:type II toxin-antitoxin system PemK/MazF family toxin [Spirochaetota bacterium]
MGTFTKKDIVLVRFPFSDLSAVKLRPALVVAALAHDDYILCQITSKLHLNPYAVEIFDRFYETGTLHTRSYIRTEKIFTANDVLIESKVASISAGFYNEIVERILRMISLDK